MPCGLAAAATTTTASSAKPEAAIRSTSEATHAGGSTESTTTPTRRGGRSGSLIGRTYTGAVALFLAEADVASLAEPADAVPVIDACFRRMAAGSVEVMPRRRFAVDGGYFAVMAAADLELGVAGLKSYTLVDGKLAFVVCLFSLEDGALQAVIEADRLGQLRTGAASGVAASYLARSGAASVGLIGCGWQAETQLAAIRAAVPTIEHALAWCRTPERLAAFCERHDAEPADGPAGGGSAATWSSPRRRPRTRCCAASGSWTAHSCAPSAPTTRAPASSTRW